jgi:hypothetical protein
MCDDPVLPRGSTTETKPNNMNTVIITTSESGTSTTHVKHYEAESRVRAGGAYRSEAMILLAFIAADGIPQSITDDDGDVWNLLDHDGGDEYVYEMQ